MFTEYQLDQFLNHNRITYRPYPDETRGTTMNEELNPAAEAVAPATAPLTDEQIDAILASAGMSPVIYTEADETKDEATIR